MGVQSIFFFFFADDIALLASGHSVKEVCDKMQKAAKVANDWGHDNMVQFDAGRTEAIRWLGIWLDSGLDLKTHYKTRLMKRLYSLRLWSVVLTVICC